jgi:hypothetical protein
LAKIFGLAVLLPGLALAAKGQAPHAPCLGAYGSPESLWKVGKSLRDLHINAVFIGHGSLSPQLVERCHSEGARVFAELTIFAGKEQAEQHPELWPINDQGQRLEPDEWYLGLCPNVSWWWENRLAEIEKIAANYGVDGIWLDFIRYPAHWEVPQPRLEQACFCPASLAAFEAATGLKVPPGDIAHRADWILRHHLQEWTQFKCRTIAEFCRQAKARLHRHRPQALLGIFSVPWREEDYGDAIHKIIAQDFQMLARHVDVFSPMSYHRMCGRPVSWIGEYNRYLVAKTKRSVWPIVQAIDHPTQVTPAEFEEALRQGLAGGASGVLMFRLADCTQENGKLEVVQRVFAAALQPWPMSGPK